MGLGGVRGSELKRVRAQSRGTRATERIEHERPFRGLSFAGRLLVALLALL